MTIYAATILQTQRPLAKGDTHETGREFFNHGREATSGLDIPFANLVHG